MMKKLLTLVAVLLYYHVSNAQFNMVADAQYLGSGTYNLLPDDFRVCHKDTPHVGAIWSTTTVNFTQSFTLTFNVAFVTRDAYPSDPGGDGMVVVFGHRIDITSSIGPGGGFMGYYRDPNWGGNPDFYGSVGVELDVYDNGGMTDTLGVVNHTMVAVDAEAFSGNIAGPVSIHPSSSPVENNGYHPYTIKWDCGRKKLSVFYANHQRLVVNNFDALDRFIDPSSVKWGFTAGRAAVCSDVFVKDIALDSSACSSCSNVDFSWKTDTDCHQIFTIIGNTLPDITAGVYTWDFGDGNTATTTNNTVSHHYAQAGSYDVRLRTGAYKLDTEECCSDEVMLHITVDCE